MKTPRPQCGLCQRPVTSKVKAPGDVKKEGTWGYLGTPRKVSQNACFFWVGACFFEGVTDNRHLDTCATINEFATHKKFCPLKKQALRTVKHVHLRHLGQHWARVVKETVDFKNK